MSLPDFAAYSRKLRAAARRVDPDATPAQREANNFRQGHLSVWGLPIAIEYAKGATRSGTGADGKKWSRVMRAHYGRIKRTVGADDEPVDVFVGEHPESALVFVIDQLTADGDLDEHKVILATRNYHEAKALYLAHYPKGWEEKHLGEVRGMLVGQFKKWLASRLPVKSRAKKADDSALRFWAALKKADNPVLTGVAGSKLPGGGAPPPTTPPSPTAGQPGNNPGYKPSVFKPGQPPPSFESGSMAATPAAPQPPNPLALWGSPATPPPAAPAPALQPRSAYPTRDFVSPGLASPAADWARPQPRPGQPTVFSDIPLSPTAATTPFERTISSSSAPQDGSPGALIRPGGAARPEEQLNNYLKTLPKPQVDAFVAALHNETPAYTATDTPPGLTPEMYARAKHTPTAALDRYTSDSRRPLTTVDSAASDQSAWEVYRRTHPNAVLPAKQIPADATDAPTAYQLTNYPKVKGTDVPAAYGTYFKAPAPTDPRPTGLIAAHEATHVTQVPAYDTMGRAYRQHVSKQTALPYSGGVTWNELTPSLGDIPREMEYLRLRTAELGDSSTLNRNTPAVTFPSGKVMDPFAMHRYAGENRLFLPTDAAPGDKPRPMAELLNTNAGRAWLRQSIQPELNNQTKFEDTLPSNTSSTFINADNEWFMNNALAQATGQPTPPKNHLNGPVPPMGRFSWFGR